MIQSRLDVHEMHAHCETTEEIFMILISNFHCVVNVVRFLLGNPLASEFYMPIDAEFFE
jgi:hypothetical protein